MKKYKGLDCILLVDDDNPINFIHQKVIEKAAIDVRVKAINNVKEALDFLTYSGIYTDLTDFPRPGIIFLDINMPGLNGWDFMAAYHKFEPRYKTHIIIVMVTTSLNPADEARAREYTEIVEFLTKPLKPETIFELVSRHFKE